MEILTQLLLFAVCVCLVRTQGSIDPADCEEISGWYGDELFCPAGYVATGACGSGRNEDCDGAYTILKCCRVVSGEIKSGLACEGQSGDHGVPYECSQGMQIISLCGSGKDQNCGGHDISAKSTCCDGNGITTGQESFCRWSQAGHGVFHECGATSEVMTGFCGSGENEDCPDGSSTMIQCCSYY